MNKMAALKTLGFNYITREISGALTAWVSKPKRVIYCLEEFSETYKKKYPDATIYTSEKDEYDKEDEWKDGLYLSCTGYERTDSVDLNSIIHLKDDDEYNKVSWEDGVMEITENGYTDKFRALKSLGFNYITRDYNGKVVAHKHVPRRVIYCTSESVSALREKYPNAIIDADTTCDDYKDGLSLFMSSWQSGQIGNYHFSNFLDLPDIEDYKEIIWEDEPFVL